MKARCAKHHLVRESLTKFFCWHDNCKPYVGLHDDMFGVIVTENRTSNLGQRRVLTGCQISTHAENMPLNEFNVKTPLVCS